MSIVIIYTYRCTLMCTAYMSRRGIILCAPPPLCRLLPAVLRPSGTTRSEYESHMNYRNYAQITVSISIMFRRGGRLYTIHTPRASAVEAITFLPFLFHRGQLFPPISFSIFFFSSFHAPPLLPRFFLSFTFHFFIFERRFIFVLFVDF